LILVREIALGGKQGNMLRVVEVGVLVEDRIIYIENAEVLGGELNISQSTVVLAA